MEAAITRGRPSEYRIIHSLSSSSSVQLVGGFEKFPEHPGELIMAMDDAIVIVISSEMMDALQLGSIDLWVSSRLGVGILFPFIMILKVNFHTILKGSLGLAKHLLDDALRIMASSFIHFLTV